MRPFHTATTRCPGCGERTFRHAFTAITDEVADHLKVRRDAEVCTVCRDRAEREVSS